MVVAGIASTFGGIHCIGWSFTFPSSPERTLWRVASISITSVPIALSIFLQDEYDFPRPLRGFFHLFPDPVTLRIMQCLLTLSSVLYILSRLVLLTLPFLCLRSLPPAAYHTVQWTSFIPHV
ncbi:hypothetical protein BC827DRAFT_1216185 [Russula dissimulans]|nr:hypothetical protein BC827DRAFT_1216185 [Russula dissimulans]